MLGSASSAQILKCWDWIQKPWSKLFRDRNFKMVSQSFHIQMMVSRSSFFSFEYSRAVKFYKSQQMTASTLPIVNYFETMLQNLKVLLVFFSPQQPLNTYKFLCISRYILENILSYSCQLKRVNRKLILSFRKWIW